VTGQRRRVAIGRQAPRAILIDEDGRLVLIGRAIDDDTDELGVTVHGLVGTELAEITASLLSQWHRQRPAQPEITAFRAPSTST